MAGIGTQVHPLLTTPTPRLSVMYFRDVLFHVLRPVPYCGLYFCVLPCAEAQPLLCSSQLICPGQEMGCGQCAAPPGVCDCHSAVPAPCSAAGGRGRLWLPGLDPQGLPVSCQGCALPSGVPPGRGGWASGGGVGTGGTRATGRGMMMSEGAAAATATRPPPQLQLSCNAATICMRC